MRVFLAGATGAVGRPLLQRLLERGHDVLALTRSPERGARLRDQGARALVGDVFDADPLTEALRAFRPEVVLHQLTSLPPRLDPRHIREELAATNRLRAEGTAVLVRAAREAGARRFVAQSIAFAYEPGPGPADEEQPLARHPPPAFVEGLRAVESCEAQTRSAEGMEGVVLRFGFFHGPGTFYAEDGTFAADVRRRRVPIVGDGGGVFSFIHVDDAAEATIAASEHGSPGIYNVVDDHPAPVREWLPLYAARLGAPPPAHVPVWLARIAAGAYGVYMMTLLRGASNRRARESLGWAPRHGRFPDRSG